MDPLTKVRIDALLAELQTWTDSPGASLDELVHRFRLDPMIVTRIAQSQGWNLTEAGVPGDIDEVDTEPLSVTSRPEGGDEEPPTTH